MYFNTYSVQVKICLHFLLSFAALTSPTGNALQAAAAEGYSNIISLLLENKPPALVDTPGGHYGSALMAAICSGSADTVWALLEERAPPNMKSKTYGSPLEKATGMGQGFKEIVSLLVDNRAEADLSPKGTGVHILHKAAMHNMIDLVEYCLDRDCQIDMITTQGPFYPRRYGDFAQEMTPLGYACAEGHVEMVDFLLSRGAPYELDKPQSAPLWTAAYQGHARVVDLLLTRFKATHSKDDVNRFFLKRPHPKSGHPILFAAASSGKPDAVRVLLDHGAKYEANWYNATPLFATATFKCPEVTEALLDYHKQGKVDVQIDKQSNNGRTALMEACALNRQRIEKMLLDAGADYTITDSGGATALHLSTDSNNNNIGRLLLEKSASEWDRQRFLNFVNIRHKGSGRTALIDSVAKNKPASFQMLLDYGADYNITGHAGNNPLLIAVQFGHNGMIEKLLRRVKSDHEAEPQRFYEYINRQNKDTETAVYGACECNQPSTVKLLLEAGADYTITNGNGQTLLNTACWIGHKAVVKTVLDYLSKNASPDDFRNFLNHRNKWGITALFEACTEKALDIIDMLLAHGSDYSIPKDSGATVLHAASHNGDLAVVERVLAFVAKKATKEQLLSFVNRPNNAGKEALWDAVDLNRPRFLQLLLKHGAAYDVPKESGVTILHEVCSNGQVELATTLLDFASKNATQQRFHEFLNQRDDDLESALFKACKTGGSEVTKLLLDHGADYTISNKSGWTVLHCCMFGNRSSTLRVLLDKTNQDRISSSASLKSRYFKVLNDSSGPGGGTALCLAASQDSIKMVGPLLEAGADWDCADSSGMTPAHWACEHKNGEMYGLLVAAAGLDRTEIGKGEERSETEKSFFDRRNIYGVSVLEAALRTGMIKKVEVPKAKA